MTDTPNLQEPLDDLHVCINHVSAIAALMAVGANEMPPEGLVQVGGLLEAIVKDMRDAQERADKAALLLFPKV